MYRLKVKDAIILGGTAGFGVELGPFFFYLEPALICSTTRLPAHLRQKTPVLNGETKNPLSIHTDVY